MGQVCSSHDAVASEGPKQPEASTKETLCTDNAHEETSVRHAPADAGGDATTPLQTDMHICAGQHNATAHESPAPFVANPSVPALTVEPKPFVDAGSLSQPVHEVNLVQSEDDAVTLTQQEATRTVEENRLPAAAEREPSCDMYSSAVKVVQDQHSSSGEDNGHVLPQVIGTANIGSEQTDGTRNIKTQSTSHAGSDSAGFEVSADAGNQPSVHKVSIDAGVMSDAYQVNTGAGTQSVAHEVSTDADGEVVSHVADEDAGVKSDTLEVKSSADGQPAAHDVVADAGAGVAHEVNTDVDGQTVLHGPNEGAGVKKIVQEVAADADGQLAAHDVVADAGAEIVQEVNTNADGQTAAHDANEDACVESIFQDITTDAGGQLPDHHVIKDAGAGTVQEISTDAGNESAAHEHETVTSGTSISKEGSLVTADASSRHSVMPSGEGTAPGHLSKSDSSVSVGAASSAKSDLLAAPSNEVLHDEVSQTALTGAPSLPCASEASHRHRSTDAMPAELPQAASGQYSKNDIKDEDRSAAGRRAHEDESVAGSS